MPARRALPRRERLPLSPAAGAVNLTSSAQGSGAEACDSPCRRESPAASAGWALAMWPSLPLARLLRCESPRQTVEHTGIPPERHVGGGEFVHLVFRAGIQELLKEMHVIG